MNSQNTFVGMGLVCWRLWYRHTEWGWEWVNKLVFGVKVMTFNLLTDRWKTREENCKKRVQQPVSNRVWYKPPLGWIKINVDASRKQGSKFIGVGCVILDNIRRFLQARSNAIIGNMQPRDAEDLNLKATLLWSKSWRNIRYIFSLLLRHWQTLLMDNTTIQFWYDYRLF